jgi:hypothetical protein
MDNVLLVGIPWPLIFFKEKFTHNCIHFMLTKQSKNQQPAQRTVTILVHCRLTSKLWWDCMCTECDLL